MKDKKIFIYGIVGIGILVFFLYGQKFKTTGDIEFISGFSNDIEKDIDQEVNYIVGYNIYNFKENTKDDSFVKSGKARSIGGVRENRQQKSGKDHIIGLQKVIIFSEENARFGISNVIDVLFSNAKVNDRSLLAVCKGKALDIINLKVKGHNSSLDFVEGMIKNLGKENFFLDEYNLLNAYITLDSEGRNCALPYLELENNKIKVTGIAVFKKDKMMYKLNLEESRIMNILRGEKSRGILTLKENYGEHLTYSAKIKRHVECYKKEDKYFFDIKLNIIADVLSNKLYKNINYDNSKEIENKIKKDLERDTYQFISKMQKIYKMDLLQLGFNAAARYGRDTGIDWDEEVSNSNIKVNVNVTTEKNSRGDY